MSVKGKSRMSTCEQCGALLLPHEVEVHPVSCKRATVASCACDGDHMCVPHYVAGQGLEAITSLAVNQAAEIARLNAVDGAGRPGGSPKGFTVLGAYRVFWASGPEGSSSIAVIGMGSDGRLWLAPSNWTAPDTAPSWDTVDRVSLVASQFGEEPSRADGGER